MNILEVFNNIFGYAIALTVVLGLLLYNRLVYVPGLRRRKAIRKCEELKQTRALRSLTESRQKRLDKTDVWKTCSHDTISRELTPRERADLSRLGIND